MAVSVSRGDYGDEDRPDSQFACVWTDASGKKQRKLPIYDAAHVRSALARYSQTDMPASMRVAVKEKLLAAAKKFHVEMSPDMMKKIGG